MSTYKVAHTMTVLLTTFLVAAILPSCRQDTQGVKKAAALSETPEYFSLRPELEKSYGYCHAVRIGNDLKISGAISMNDKGEILAPGDMEQQMKNCYSDLEKILQHYEYTFEHVVVENIYTTNMKALLTVSGFRNAIYKEQFPTGNWIEVKGLAIDGQLIEIDLEAHK